MRLINTTTLHLSEFTGSNIPKYAILTHTWEEEEVSYQDWLSWEQTGDAAIGRRKGFQKIQGACRQALKNHLDWLWVDTNCIDKSSSAELSEAINSMYAWYRDARICYGYLADVSSPGPSGVDTLGEIERSRWFTRGWTLQELLAPRFLVFFSNTWIKLGHRSGMLVGTIERATGIPAKYLISPGNVHMASDSMKMSWLSQRETTRVEDMAYCMLGLFSINMPLLYGEGAKAFTRLQEEIIRSHQDHTIFCWDFIEDKVPPSWSSMLAPSPRVFEAGWRYTVQKHNTNPIPYSITNIGLSIYLPVFYTLEGVVAILNAADSPGRTERRSCIFLQREFGHSAVFWRMEFPSIPIELLPVQLRIVIPVHLHVTSARPPIRATEKDAQPWYENDDIDRLRDHGRGRRIGELGAPTRPTRPTAPSRFVVFLFIEPSMEEFFVNDTERTLLSMRKVALESIPRRAYESICNRIDILPYRITNTPNYASILKIGIPGVMDTFYFLFAVQWSEEEEYPVWFCDIATTEQLVFKGIARESELGWWDLENVMNHWVKLVAANWREQTQVEVSGRSSPYLLTLGNRLRTWGDVEYRPAVLSRKKSISFTS